MASVNSETTFSYIKKYKVGAGTIDLGRGYEFKMVALISLRCLLQDFDDMWIAFNADGLGALDDVVVNAQRKDGGNMKILLQLKHEDKEKDIVREQFLAPRGNYSILKYCTHIVKLKERFDCKSEQTGIIKDLGTFNNMYFVLFTNKGISGADFLEDGGCDEILFLNTSKNDDELYKLDLSKVSTLSSLSNLDYSINFCLFAKQSHANHLDELIESEIKNVIRRFGLTHVNIENVSSMFIKYVTDWAMGKLGNHYYLTKQGILYKLTELLLCQYEIDLSLEEFDFYDGPQKRSWNEVVEDKVVTVIDSDDEVIQFLKLYIGCEIRSYYQISGKLWNDKFSSEEQILFYQQHFNLKTAMLKIVGNNGKITLLSIYKCLWFNERLPLLLKTNTLEEYEIILKIIKLSNCKLKVIILNTTKLIPTVTNLTPGYFTTLSDLNNECRRKILNNSVKLQGRPSAVLRELIDDSLFQHINCNVIIRILSGNFNIGIEYKLPFEYFIERSVLKVFLKIDVVEQTEDETFVIEINEGTEDESIRNELEMLISRNNIKTNIIFGANIPKQIQALKLRKKPIHRLTFHDKNLLEWNESFGSTSNILKYQFSHGLDFNGIMRSSQKNAHPLCNKLEDILVSNNTNNFFNDVNLVSASPGMGKSTLLDYVTWRASTKIWVLNVKLMDYEDHYDYTKSRGGLLTAQDHLEYFNNSILEKRDCTDNELARGVFQKFVAAKQVLVMLDGFDEVSVSYRNEVVEITNCLHEAGFPIWLTTRPHLKTDLEEKFATISITLRPFSVNDQEQFLNRYFKHIGDTVDDNKEKHPALIDEFVKKLLQASRDNLNDADDEFTGIPLQTKLLANAFSEELKRSLSTGTIEFERRFDLLHLYEEFLKRKDNILSEKFGKRAKHMNILIQKHQQLSALKLVFSDHNLYRLGIDGQLNDYYTNNEDHIQFLQQDGVTVIQRNVTGTEHKFEVGFVHRTFAEYMAALWLFNNFNSECEQLRWTARFLLDKREKFINYGLLFLMFDSMLAKDSRLHLLIINGRLDEAQTLVTSNPDIMDEVDAGGRSWLHMLALYGGAHRDRHVKHVSEVKDGMTDFVEQIPKYKIINMKDKLGYSSLDYAMLNRSFAAARKLYGKSKEITISTNMLYLYNIYTKCGFTCGLNLKYKTLIKKHLSLIICQELLVDSNTANHHITIKSYCCKLFKSNKSIIEILNEYTKELDITTISELLTSNGIKSATEPYYYNLRFASAFGTARNVLDLISSAIATVNQQTFNNFYSPLYLAVKYNRLEIVEILLSHGENVNEFGMCTNNNTPLHCAAENGYTKIAKELLSNQADVNLQNDAGETPLILAIQNKHADIAKLLLSHYANINLKDIFDCFPMYYAAACGLDDIIPNLIEGVDINQPNFDDNTPLDVAISNGHLSTVRLLLLNGADCNIPNNQNKLPLHTAAAAGFRKIVAEILSKTVNSDGTISSNYSARNATCDKHEAVGVNTTNKRGRAPLHLRIGKWVDLRKRLQTRNVLRNKGTNTNIQDIYGNTALHYLCQMPPLNKDNEKSAATLLLDKGADANLKNRNGETPLHVCVKNRHPEDNPRHFFEIVPHLLRNNGNANVQDFDGNTALHHLCYKFPLQTKDGKRAVKLFLKNGADVNLKNNDGRIPLHVFLLYLSSEDTSTHIRASLLSNKANISMRDGHGNTAPNQFSVDTGSRKTADSLPLKKRVDIKLEFKNGDSPLRVAVRNLCSESNSRNFFVVVPLLLRNNANINTEDVHGNTALHHLCYKFPLETDDGKRAVKLLLDKGADVNFKNNDGETPLQVFLSYLYLKDNSRNLFEIVSLLSTASNVNIQDVDGNTALHHLCSKRPLNEVKGDRTSAAISLLDKGADVNLKNQHGKRALDVAVLCNFTKMISVLQQN